MQCLHMDPANEDVGKELGSMCLIILVNLLCSICKYVKMHCILIPPDLSINSEMSMFNSQISVHCIDRDKGIEVVWFQQTRS